jgi:hypothetical protein
LARAERIARDGFRGRREARRCHRGHSNVRFSPTKVAIHACYRLWHLGRRERGEAIERDIST